MTQAPIWWSQKTSVPWLTGLKADLAEPVKRPGSLQGSEVCHSVGLHSMLSDVVRQCADVKIGMQGLMCFLQVQVCEVGWLRGRPALGTLSRTIQMWDVDIVTSVASTRAEWLQAAEAVH